MRDLIKGTSLAFFLRISGAALALIFNLILGRSFGPEGVGHFYLTLSVVAIVSVFGRMGTEISLIRFTAANRAAHDYSALSGAYKEALRFTFLASAFGAILLFFLAEPLSHYVFKNNQLTVLLKIGSLAVLPFSLSLLHAEALKGLKKIIPAMAFLPQGGIIVTPILIVALLVIGKDESIRTLLIAYSISAFIVMAGGILTWRYFTKTIRSTIASFSLKKLLRSSFPLFIMSLTFLILEWSGTFLLEVMRTSEEVGIFNVAYRLAVPMTFILTALNVTIAPRYAEFHKLRQTQEIKLHIKNATLIGLMIALPILLALLLFPGFLMGLFGNEFITGAAALQILALGQFINVVTGTLPQLLIMSGKERYVMYNTIAGGLLNIILNIVLIPPLGLIGAAIATAASISVINLLALWQIRYKLFLNLLK